MYITCASKQNFLHNCGYRDLQTWNTGEASQYPETCNIWSLLVDSDTRCEWEYVLRLRKIMFSKLQATNVDGRTKKQEFVLVAECQKLQLLVH